MKNGYKHQTNTNQSQPLKDKPTRPTRRAYTRNTARQNDANIKKKRTRPNRKEKDRKNKNPNQSEYSMRNLTARLMLHKQTLFLTAGNCNTLTFLKTYRYIDPPRNVIRW